MVPMLRQWMLAHAYMVDSENSQFVMQLSAKHMEIYNMLVRAEQVSSAQEEVENGSLRAVPNRPAQ
ncbi:MAG: hypothetical protein HDQ88_05645 [Clostridia bacterium]|nr:hypothetical protein [Clostridia bacterium]